MSTEKFDPAEYKTLEELPEEKKKFFKPVEGGFVEIGAIEAKDVAHVDALVEKWEREQKDIEKTKTIQNEIAEMVSKESMGGVTTPDMVRTKESIELSNKQQIEEIIRKAEEGTSSYVDEEIPVSSRGFKRLEWLKKCKRAENPRKFLFPSLGAGALAVLGGSAGALVLGVGTDAALLSMGVGVATGAVFVGVGVAGYGVAKLFNKFKNFQAENMFKKIRKLEGHQQTTHRDWLPDQDSARLVSMR